MSTISPSLSPFSIRRPRSPGEANLDCKKPPNGRIDLEPAFDIEEKLLLRRFAVRGIIPSAAMTERRPVHCFGKISALGLWAEIDAADLRIGGWHTLAVAVSRGGAGKIVGMNKRRIERPAELERFLVDRGGGRSVEIGATLQPAAQTAAMDVDQRVDMIEQIGGYRARQRLGEVSLRRAGKDLMQVGLAMLLGRLPIKDGDRQRICHGNCGDRARKAKLISME